MRGDAADPGIDLVEHECLSPRHSGEGERDAGKLSARGGLGDRPERHAGIRANQEDGPVGAGRARLSIAQLDPELTLAHPHAVEVLRHGGGKRLSGRRPGLPQRESRPAGPITSRPSGAWFTGVPQPDSRVSPRSRRLLASA